MRWKTVKLSDVADTASGGTPSRSNELYWNGTIPWIKSGQLQDCTIESAEEYITEEGLKNSSAKVVQRGTLVLALYGATAGKLGFLGLDATTNQAVCAISTKEDVIHSRFLYYHLLSRRARIIADSAGGAQPNISQNYVRNMVISLPPLPVQKQIADMLDKADALRQRDQALLHKYDELAQAIFYEIFGDPVRNERGWKVSKLKDVAEFVQIGPFGSLLHAEDYIAGGTPLVNPSHIKQSKIVVDDSLTVNDEKLRELRNYRMHKGDVVMGRRGEMGRCAVITEVEDGWLCGTGSLFIRPKDVIKPQVLAIFLSHPSTKSVLEKSSMGTTMNNLNQTIVCNLDLIVPPVAIQQKFLESLNSIDTQQNHLKLNVQNSDRLFKILLNQTFN